MEVEFTYDWLGVTLPYDSGLLFLSGDRFGNRVDGSEAIARNGYTRAAAWESGVVANWNDSRQEMGFHIEFSGSALRWLALHGVSGQYLIDGFNDEGGRFSRIDLAIDIHNGLLTFADFAKSNCRPYKGKGRTPKNKGWQSEDGGWTQYYGSRSSAYCLRIYNKAAERKLKNVDYTRVELEVKKYAAHGLGKKLYALPREEVFKLASTLIRGRADFNNVAWQEAMGRETAEISLPRETAKDTLKWLLETAAPSLARVIRERPSESIFEKFMKSLTAEMPYTMHELVSRELGDV